MMSDTPETPPTDREALLQEIAETVQELARHGIRIGGLSATSRALTEGADSVPVEVLANSLRELQILQARLHRRQEASGVRVASLRRTVWIAAIVAAMAGAATVKLLEPSTGEEEKGEIAETPGSPRLPRPKSYKKLPVPDVGYQELVPEVSFPGLSLADRSTDIGRAQRAVRFENIIKAVADRYGIPPYVLYGMIMQESYGDPLQPNSSGDGGLGLIHMQPLLATEYGLKLIDGSRSLRDFGQGRRIEDAIELEGADLKRLIVYDDRFHPIKNVDAAARMLCDMFRSKGWWGALKRYAGRGSYPAHVTRFGKLLESPKFRAAMAEDFRKRNPGRSFHEYVGHFHQMNNNYGLQAYRGLPRYKAPR